jgi:hypothetical protein
MLLIGPATTPDVLNAVCVCVLQAGSSHAFWASLPQADERAMSVKASRTRHVVPTHVRVARRPRFPRRASNAATSAGHRCLTAQTRPSGDDRPCSPSPPVPRLEPDVELRPSRPRLKFP